LAGYFLDEARGRLGLGPVRLSAAARAVLAAYDWPGNVRELEHVVLRAALRAAGGRRREAVVIDADHLALSPGTAAASPDAPAPDAYASMTLREAVEAFERRLIDDAVRAAGGNWAEAARRLGLHRANLHRMARRLGLAGE